MRNTFSIAIAAVVFVGLVGSAAKPEAHAKQSAHVFVSPSGSDSDACTRNRPCSTFDRAYRVARPGQTVELAAGTYPTQTIGVDRSKLDVSPPCSLRTTASCVVFRPAPKATVVVDGDLVMYGSNAIFRGSPKPFTFRITRNLRSEAVAGPATSHRVVFENLDGAAFLIGPNHHIMIKGGDWGPNSICGSDPAVVENKVGPSGEIRDQWPHDVVLDGLIIHDQNSYDLRACHMGGLFLVSGYRLVLRNSIFSQNAVYDVLVQDFTSPECCLMKFGQPRSVLIENNWFGAPVTGRADPGGDTTNDRQPELQFDERFGGWRDFLIRYNSFHNGLDFATAGGTPSFERIRVVANIGRAPRCFAGFPGITWTSNAWQGGRCASSDVQLRRLPYVRARIGAENFHLTGGRAQNLVRTKTRQALPHDLALATDIDEQRRPRGRGRDAGADER